MLVKGFVDCRLAPCEQRPLEKSGDIFAWHATHVPRRARAFRGWIERKHYWIGNTGERLIGMQWCIAIYTWSWRVPVVGLWRILRLKQTIGMQGERPIYSSLGGMRKKPTFPDKGDIGLWPSGSLPDARYSRLPPSSPLKTRLEIRDRIRANSFLASKLDVSRVCFFRPLKATCPSYRIVSSPASSFFRAACSQCKAAVYETTRFHCDFVEILGVIRKKIVSSQIW